MNDKNNDSETLTTHQRTFLSRIVGGLITFTARLPMAALFGLGETVLYLMEIYRDEWEACGRINCEFRIRVTIEPNIVKVGGHVNSSKGGRTIVIPHVRDWVSTDTSK